MNRKRIITVVILFILLISSISQAFATNFKYYYDIFNHWAVEAIMWASNDVKLFKGYEDGTFRPDNNITIAEYVTLLYRSGRTQGLINDYSDIDTSDSPLSYSDLNEEFWGYKEITAVDKYIDAKNSELKFIDLFQGEKLQPNRYITREEAVVLASFFTSPPINTSQARFEDIGYDYEYIKQLSYLVNNKIIEGYDDNTFKPQQYVTRAESATIFIRLYNDMKFLKEKYLQKIQLVNVPKYRRFMLFGDYDNIILTNEDKLYRRAVATLEYISIIHHIPYEERHLYDSNPIKTLKSLRDSKYWNVIGTNYYIINQGSQSDKDNNQLYQDLLEDYIAREDLSDDESVIVFEIDYHNLNSLDDLIFALDKWYNSKSDYVTKLNSLFLKSKAYSDNGETLKAIKLYDSQVYFDLGILNNENLESSDIDLDTDSRISIMELDDESKKCYFMNKAYTLILNNQYYEAEKTLRDGWSIINSDQYEEQFIGAIKQVLIEIEKRKKLVNQINEETSDF